MLQMGEWIHHWKMKEDHEQVVKDFDWILMVQVYDDEQDERRILIDDLIDLFVGMNVEMNWKNDVNDYYDDFDDLNDYANVIGNDFVNENDLIYKKQNQRKDDRLCLVIVSVSICITHLYYCCYLHYVFLIDYYCYYYWNC